MNKRKAKTAAEKQSKRKPADEQEEEEEGLEDDEGCLKKASTRLRSALSLL